MKLKILLTTYLNLGKYFDCFFYRKIGLICIFFYQWFFRKTLNRKCQFKINCSNFIKEHLTETKKFEELFTIVNARILDCSKPLNISFSLKSGIIATGGSLKKYKEDELSEKIINDFKKNIDTN